MDEEILINSETIPRHIYEYTILDQSNQEIENPDLTLGYLKKEYFTVHHESVPEKWHYQITSFDFSDGEIYTVESQSDPHVQIVDSKRGIFNYVPLEGEEKRIVTGQTISAVIDQQMAPAWDETKTFYRYVLYSEKELAEKDFLVNGPKSLADAQETIDELLLVIADLLGGEEE